MKIFDLLVVGSTFVWGALLTGCGPKMTHDQAIKVIDACNKSGMDYQIRDNVIQCWTKQ